eukprot:gb/GFBE01004504.1/.p1 GENE.gb/GFBE01004504.1/~~gb/GFBE01004504.1/.p1  ORF type:complete len:649 (+),score=158.00 gb/GFBE01004504.1/:1-1947(+)
MNSCRKRLRQHVAAGFDEAPQDGEAALESLRLATAEVAELVDAPQLTRPRHLQRLCKAVFALPENEQCSHTDAVVRSLRTSRRAFMATSEDAKAILLGDYVALLGSSLRDGILSKRAASEVYQWLREALAESGSAGSSGSADLPCVSHPPDVEGKKRMRFGRAPVESSEEHKAAFGFGAPFFTPSEPGSSCSSGATSSKVSAKSGMPNSAPSLPPRLERLQRRLLSPAVQLPMPGEATEEPLRLSEQEVEAVFERHVPGVRDFIYRQQPGVFSLKFMCGAYQEGLRAFAGTSLHKHLLWLFRRIVHDGHDDRPGASRYLREVAEAFTDCQAVQARIIEKLGLQLCGLGLDFKGHLVRLVGEYKAMAVKELAVQKCTELGGPDEYNDPAHYENRLIADLGEMVGLNQADIRQAKADSHAHQRFRPYTQPKREKAAAQLRSIFDLKALLKAFSAEVSSLGDESSTDSLPRVFIEWANEHMTQKHALLDEDTGLRVEVAEPLALAVFEAVFLGRPGCDQSEVYRNETLIGLFHHDEELAAQVEKEEAEAAKEEALRAAGSEPAEAKLTLEVQLDSHWAQIDADIVQQFKKAEAAGETEFRFRSRGFLYKIDLQQMVQINLQTGKQRKIRLVEASEEEEDDESFDSEDTFDD